MTCKFCNQPEEFCFCGSEIRWEKEIKEENGQPPLGGFIPPEVPEEQIKEQIKIEEEAVNDSLSSSDDVFRYIKAHDSGSGVSIEDVLEQFQSRKLGMGLIEKMQKKGDLVETSPGRLKPL